MVEGEAPPYRGNDELEGRGALVSPTSGGAAVAAAVVAGRPREEAGHLGWMNPDPRGEEDVVDHQTLKYSIEQGHTSVFRRDTVDWDIFTSKIFHL